jgi:hypothetical protein
LNRGLGSLVISLRHLLTIHNICDRRSFREIRKVSMLTVLSINGTTGNSAKKDENDFDFLEAWEPCAYVTLIMARVCIVNQDGYLFSSDIH